MIAVVILTARFLCVATTIQHKSQRLQYTLFKEFTRYKNQN